MSPGVRTTRVIQGMQAASVYRAGLLAVADGPAVLLPNGNVLVAGGGF
jgi:hypothetical protein